MSLLMDALRKAEQEKKVAANRLIDPPSQLSVEEEAKEPDATDFHEPAPRHSGAVASADITLDIMAADLKSEHLPEETPHAVRQSQTLQEPDENAPELFQGTPPGADTDTDTDDNELGPVQKAAPGAAYTAELDPASDQETLPGVSAVQFAEDVGSKNTPTPVGAQTVFAATGTTHHTAYGYRWLLMSAAILAIVAAGLWYYSSLTPRHRVLPLPQMVRGIEPAPRPVPTQTGTGDSSGWQADNAAMLEADGGATMGTKAPPSASPASSVALSQDSEDVMAIAANAANAANEDTAPADEELDISVVAIDADLQDIGDIGDTGAQDPEPPAALFKISRGRPGGARSQLLNAAYRAYQAGKFERARQMYTEILAASPDNRDALLGLGAIALHASEKRQATMFYKEILRLNPEDSIARIMLMNLHSEPDQINSISKIKSMLHENPELPALHFALGNLYAQQSRWAKAQQAFLTAYRLDASNPDYAFNFAVSLDQSGRYEAALDHYNVALKLADARTVHFDPGVVSQRISALSARN